MTAPAELTDIAYSTDGPIAWITFNRPKYRNAQSWRLLDEFGVADQRPGRREVDGGQPGQAARSRSQGRVGRGADFTSACGGRLGRRAPSGWSRRAW